MGSLGSEGALGSHGRLFAIALAVGLTIGPAALAGATDGTEGELLTDEEQPRESYYWRIQDDYRVYYDSTLGLHYGYEETNNGASYPSITACDAEDDLPYEGCQDLDGVCAWNVGADGWRTTDEEGAYHAEDFDHGRCAAVFAQQRDGATMVDARAAVDATVKALDPSCEACEEVTGLWDWRVDVQWLADGGPFSTVTLWEASEVGEACLAPEELYGLAVYADCIWGAVELDLSEHAPDQAEGFEVDVILTDDGETRQRAFVDCPGCLG